MDSMEVLLFNDELSHTWTISITQDTGWGMGGIVCRLTSLYDISVCKKTQTIFKHRFTWDTGPLTIKGKWTFIDMHVHLTLQIQDTCP